jgi:hypothetical protein
MATHGGSIASPGAQAPQQSLVEIIECRRRHERTEHSAAKARVSHVHAARFWQAVTSKLTTGELSWKKTYYAAH